MRFQVAEPNHYPSTTTECGIEEGLREGVYKDTRPRTVSRGHYLAFEARYTLNPALDLNPSGVGSRLSLGVFGLQEWAKAGTWIVPVLGPSVRR